MNSKTTQLLTFVGLITVIAVGALILEYKRISIVHTRTDALKNELVDSQVKTLKMSSLRRAALSGSDELVKIKDFIIEPGQEVEVVQLIEGLSKSSGLTYTTETIALTDYAPLTGQGKELLHIVITTQGSWRGTQKFLSLVENLPYNVRIDTVDTALTGSEGNTLTGTWKTKFDISLVKKK